MLESSDQLVAWFAGICVGSRPLQVASRKIHANFRFFFFFFFFFGGGGGGGGGVFFFMCTVTSIYKTPMAHTGQDCIRFYMRLRTSGWP